MVPEEEATAEQLAAPAERTRHRQLLPFTVTLVTTESELKRAIAVRASAYLRHHAPGADLLNDAEEDDRRDDTAVLVARSKLDDGVLGTIRINTNFSGPLQFEASARLSPALSARRCVEFMRLGVEAGPQGLLVTQALAKASYEICVATDVEYIFVASRTPVDVVYGGYRFDDHLQGKRVEIHYAPGVPHTILRLPVKEAPARWKAHSPRVHRFFMETDHPDIQIDYREIARRFGKATVAL